MRPNKNGSKVSESGGSSDYVRFEKVSNAVDLLHVVERLIRVDLKEGGEESSEKDV